MGDAEGARVGLLVGAAVVGAPVGEACEEQHMGCKRNVTNTAQRTTREDKRARHMPMRQAGGSVVANIHSVRRESVVAKIYADRRKDSGIKA